MPLKVFGDHDEGTLAQMRNCMKVGNVVAGVICADGHLGYAQPVGGVIAYEKQISISGVGFDIGCGNMAVRLDTPFAAIADQVGPIITWHHDHNSVAGRTRRFASIAQVSTTRPTTRVGAADYFGGSPAPGHCETRRRFR